MNDSNIPFSESFLELVHWKSLDDWNNRELSKIAKIYTTFDETAAAIDEHGPIEISTDQANAYFTRTAGRFEDDIVAVRQSGMNIRRILISKATFDRQYGDFQRCVDSVLSNNAIGPSVEYAHARDYGEALEIREDEINEDRRYDRAEIDITSVLQMLGLRDGCLSDYEEEEAGLINFIFDIGFTAGRSFSAIQNLMILEPQAQQAINYKEQNKEKGKRSGSDRRKKARLDKFIDCIEAVFEQNPAMRPYEDMVLRAAFDSAVPQGEYGHGQFSAYCTTIRSDKAYKARFDRLFRKSVK